jgi:hypothetical protein
MPQSQFQPLQRDNLPGRKRLRHPGWSALATMALLKKIASAVAAEQQLLCSPVRSLANDTSE